MSTQQNITPKLSEEEIAIIALLNLDKDKERRCCACGDQNPRQWRRFPTRCKISLPLCNACGIRISKNNGF